MARDTRVSGKYDWVSFALVFGIWPLYLLWEGILLLKRKYWDSADDGSPPNLISGEAKIRGWQLNSIVYVWSGMASHWWWSADWGSTWAGITFWAIAVALLGFDIYVWKRWGAPSLEWPKWLRWARYPALWMAAGILGGRFLFPQAWLLPWSWNP